MPLFFKAAGQRRGRMNRAYARTVDVLPTVAGSPSVRLPFAIDGRSAFGPAARGAAAGADPDARRSAARS